MPLPTNTHRLAEALFAPRSVALIGISDDAAKTAGRPLRFLRKHGFAGAIHPVNPRRETVQGERAYASLDDVPGTIDHAYILVNTPSVEEAVADCARHGVAVATILAAGFAEAGEDGRRRQQRLVELAGAGGMRLVGPNSLGVVNAYRALTLTANASFLTDTLPKGRLTVISQSGSLLGTFLSRGGARGIGFAKMISVGNEADLSVGEIGAMLADDPDTDAFLLFLETIRRPEEIARFAALARHAGKPILAYKLGRSEAGQELAVSHTGAMLGSDIAAEVFLRRHGIERVDHLETLLEAAPLMIGRAPAAGRRARGVGVVATTGGGAAMVVDRLGMLGVEVAVPSAATAERLKTAGIAAEPGRILDLTLAGTRYEVMRAALDTLLAAPEFALVVAVVGSSAQFNPELAVKPIIDCAGNAKPIAVFLTPQADATLSLLAAHGVAAFRTPEACADGIAAYLRRTQRAPEAAIDAATVARARSVLQEAPGEVLDERRSAAFFAALGIPPVASITLDLDGTLRSLPFPFPVAAKVLSADIPHKTEAGGVALGIASPQELGERARVLVSTVRERRPEARLDGILVQPMTAGVAELLLGYRRDPQVGPVVTVGMGGTLAELYRDFAVRMAPVSAAEATDMITELRGAAVLSGYRGAQAGDVAALADAVARISMLAQLPEVVEAEINPLIVKPAGGGVTAVDGLVHQARD